MDYKTMLSKFTEEELFLITDIYLNLKKDANDSNFKIVKGTFHVNPDLTSIGFQAITGNRNDDITFMGMPIRMVESTEVISLSGVELNNYIRKINLKSLVEEDEEINLYIKEFGILHYLLSVLKEDSKPLYVNIKEAYNEMVKVFKKNKYFKKNSIWEYSDSNIHNEIYEFKDIILNEEKQQIYLKALRNKTINTTKVVFKAIGEFTTFGEIADKYEFISEEEYHLLYNKRQDEIKAHPRYVQYSKYNVASLKKAKSKGGYFDIDRSYINALLMDKEHSE